MMYFWSCPLASQAWQPAALKTHLTLQFAVPILFELKQSWILPSTALNQIHYVGKLQYEHDDEPAHQSQGRPDDHVQE